MKKIFLFVLLFLSMNIFIYPQSASSYSIINKFKLKGDGYWDYLTIDSKGRLFISHNTMVQVADSKTGTLIDTIVNMKRVHGIALAEDLNKGFITSGGDSTLVVFDFTTLKVLDKVKVTGANPDAVLFDPYSNKVFTFNGKSSNATVIDAKTNKIISTIKLEGKPEFAVTDKKGKIYVNIEDKSLLTCISADSFKVIKNWSIAPGKEPSGLAADFSTGKLFSVCDSKKMMVFDIKSEKIVDSLTIGEGTDGAAFDLGLKKVYSSNGDGTLTVVGINGGGIYNVIENVTTQKGARTICIDQTTHHIFMPTAEFESTKDDKGRPKVKSGTFVILEIAPKN